MLHLNLTGELQVESATDVPNPFWLILKDRLAE